MMGTIQGFIVANLGVWEVVTSRFTDDQCSVMHLGAKGLMSV